MMIFSNCLWMRKFCFRKLVLKFSTSLEILFWINFSIFREIFLISKIWGKKKLRSFSKKIFLKMFSFSNIRAVLDEVRESEKEIKKIFISKKKTRVCTLRIKKFPRLFYLQIKSSFIFSLLKKSDKVQNQKTFELLLLEIEMRSQEVLSERF